VKTHVFFEVGNVVAVGRLDGFDPLSAAVGLSQMARITEFIENRQAVCATYSQAFSSLSWCKPVATSFDGVSPFIYSLRVLDGLRPAFIAHMDLKGVATGIHFVPVHRHSHFRDCRRDALPVTERVCEEVVTLPLHSLMPLRTVDRVLEAVTSFQP